MYLSLLGFSPLRREALRLLQDPYRTHAAIMRGFARNVPDARPLFRVEQSPNGGPIPILVQSATEPDWSPLAEELGSSFESSVKPLSLRFGEGQRLRFRLRANPTIKRNGKRLGLSGDEAQFDWLMRKAEVSGFRIRPEDVRAVDEGTARGRKVVDESHAHRISFLTVLYDGRLEVEDPNRMLHAVCSGVGSAKGLGCGLLSVAPDRGA